MNIIVVKIGILVSSNGRAIMDTDFTASDYNENCALMYCYEYSRVSERETIGDGKYQSRN